MLDSVEIDGEPDGMEEIEVTELDLYFFFWRTALYGRFFVWCGGHFFLILA